MGYMIQIEERKADEMREHARKMLRHGGKLMECIEDLCEESYIGERNSGNYGSRYGNRSGGGYSGGGGGYGNRMGYREEEDWEEDYEQPYPIGQRRGVRGTGRYSRFR